MTTLKGIKDTHHNVLNVISTLRSLLKFLLSLRLLYLVHFRIQYTMNAKGRTVTPTKIRVIETGRAMSVPGPVEYIIVIKVTLVRGSKLV